MLILFHTVLYLRQWCSDKEIFWVFNLSSLWENLCVDMCAEWLFKFVALMLCCASSTLQTHALLHFGHQCSQHSTRASCCACVLGVRGAFFLFPSFKPLLSATFCVKFFSASRNPNSGASQLYTSLKVHYTQTHIGEFMKCNTRGMAQLRDVFSELNCIGAY
jgi:hypothetical protein